MTIHLARTSYFRVPGQQTLQFVEHSPIEETHDYAVCNCTRAVKDRPAGEPESTQQRIEFRAQVGDQETSLVLDGVSYLEAAARARGCPSGRCGVCPNW